MTFLPVILAGGCGTRLWPLSTPDSPKQFLPLTEGRSLFQETIARLVGTGASAPLVICNENHHIIAQEQLRGIGIEKTTFLLEPVGRSTAPAAALAALLTAGRQPDTVLLILPSDHMIADIACFHEAVATAAAFAASGNIAAFGIAPDHAETGYGYIRRGRALRDGRAFAIESFVEKPDAETALRLLNSGDHHWNSGMFMVRADRYIDELGRHRPDILEACRHALCAGGPATQSVHVDAAAFASCASISIDRAVMEKTDTGVMVPLDAGWSDIGSWPSLWRALSRNADGNALMGHVIAMASRNNLVHAGGKPVILLGVDDLTVVEAPDAILVARRGAAGNAADLIRLFRASTCE